jgi:GNAT superfamily N-acetyltransferase
MMDAFSKPWCIRAASKEDADALQALFALCVSTAQWLPETSRAKTTFADVSAGESIWLACSNTNDAINETGHALLGFVSVQTAEPYIHHLYVHPKARGEGVGSALLQSLQSWLPSPWHLKCVRANHAAMAFYQAHGWIEVGGGVSDDGAFALLQWTPQQTAP